MSMIDSNHINHVAIENVTNNIRKFSHERLSDVAVDNGMQVRILENSIERYFNARDKFTPQAVTLLFVPSMSLVQIGLRLG